MLSLISNFVPSEPRAQIYQPTDDEVQDAALKATQVLLQTLYPSEVFEGLGPLMLQDCVQTLREPEKSKAAPTLKVVNTLIQATCKLLLLYWNIFDLSLSTPG